MPVGNSLKRLRRQYGGISQERLARAIGVTRQTIYSIEKGKYVPSTLLALKIAAFFEKPLEEVFYLIEEERGGAWR